MPSVPHSRKGRKALVLERLFCFASSSKQAERCRAGKEARRDGKGPVPPGRAWGSQRPHSPGGTAARAGPAGPRCGLRPRFPPLRSCPGPGPGRAPSGRSEEGGSGSGPGGAPAPAPSPLQREEKRLPWVLDTQRGRPAPAAALPKAVSHFSPPQFKCKSVSSRGGSPLSPPAAGAEPGRGRGCGAGGAGLPRPSARWLLCNRQESTFFGFAFRIFAK